MQSFWDAVARRAAQMDAQRGQPRFATVASYDPNTGAAQVLIQPEGVLSGWLPVLSHSVGAGWGMHVPLAAGDQVFVIPHEGNADHGVVVGGGFCAVARPPHGTGGAAVRRSSAGAVIQLQTNGQAVIRDPSGTTLTFTNDGNLVLQGNLHVSGDITDRNGAYGALNDLRDAYNAHEHGDVQNGVGKTSTTDHAVT